MYQMTSFPMSFQTNSCLSFLVSLPPISTYINMALPFIAECLNGSCPIFNRGHFEKVLLMLFVFFTLSLFLLCRYLYVPYLSGIGLASQVEDAFSSDTYVYL